MNDRLKQQSASSTQEVLAGLVERVHVSQRREWRLRHPHQGARSPRIGDRRGARRDDRRWRVGHRVGRMDQRPHPWPATSTRYRANAGMTDAMTQIAQGPGDLAKALDRPAQRLLGITALRRRDDPLHILDQTRVGVFQQLGGQPLPGALDPSGLRRFPAHPDHGQWCRRQSR